MDTAAPADPDTIRVLALRRLDALTKPLGSLGRLEPAVAQVCAIQRTLAPRLEPAVALLFAADHGIAAEAVSAYPRAVTAQMVCNFLAGGAAASVLSRRFGCELRVVDVGVDAPLPDHPSLERRKVACGTANLLHGAAMSAAQLEAALAAGNDAARAALDRGARVLVLGEMGIGNTSCAALLCAALTGAPIELCTGRGTGLGDDAFERKRAILRAAWRRHVDDCGGRAAAGPFSATEARAALCSLGGFEVAALAGAILATRASGCAVLIDGVTVTAAAACAHALEVDALEHCLFAHRSAEPAHALLLRHLGVEPLLDLDMRLGEGSGALLALPILQAALALFAEMATFEGAGVSLAVGAPH